MSFLNSYDLFDVYYTDKGLANISLEEKLLLYYLGISDSEHVMKTGWCTKS